MIMKIMMNLIFYAGTDRSNILQIADLNDNFLMPFERSTMWNNANICRIYHKKLMSPRKPSTDHGVCLLLQVTTTVGNTLI